MAGVHGENPLVVQERIPLSQVSPVTRVSTVMSSRRRLGYLNK